MPTDTPRPLPPVDRLHLTVILASTRESRFGPVVGRWFLDQAQAFPSFTVDAVDLVDHPLPAAMPRSPEPAVARLHADLSARLSAADAYVIVTPEYNHSFPGFLKIALDSFRAEWMGKPFAFVSYGGISGGLRAVEHLRPVISELHATSIRETVSFHGAWAQFDEEGAPRDPEATGTAAKKMLIQLAWWAEALREARAHTPYPG